MKKMLFLAIVAVMMAASANAQTWSTVMVGKPNFAIQGGEEGKRYEISVKSDKDRRGQVDDMTALLRKYKIVQDVDLDEIDDTKSVFTVPFRLPLTVDACKGVMGMPYASTPVVLNGELEFKFNENGKTTIAMKNLSNTLFIVTRKDEVSPKVSATMEKLKGEMAAAIASKNPFTKFLVWANVGLDNMADFYAKLDEYYEERDSKYEVYEQLVADGEAKWMTPKEYVEWMNTWGKRNTTMLANGVKNYMDAGCLPAVSEDRWLNCIRTEIDRLFAASTQKLGGVVNKIKEDDETLWSSADGDVFPLELLNPKNREARLKKK